MQVAESPTNPRASLDTLSPSTHLDPASPAHSYSSLKSPPDDKVPVPWRRLIPLSFFPISEAMTYAVLFPFVTAMITSFGVDSSRVGLYAGIGEGVMMLVEAMMAPLWARLADQHGRRPMLLLGFSACVLACPMVGFSQAVWQLILWRACLGLNPTGVIYKTMTAELSHPSNRAQIVSMYSPSFSLGMVVGTFIGGHLASPSGRLPAVLGGRSTFWVEHPYALPCVVVGGLNALTLLNGLLFLHETRRHSLSLITSSPSSSQVKGKFRQTTKVPGFLRIITIYLLFQINTYSWEAMFTIWTYTSPDRGGLGLAVETIGSVFACSYLFTVLIYPFALPRIQKRLGSVRALRLVLAVWPILAVLMPAAQWAAVINARGVMWWVICVQLDLRATGTFAWALCEILMVNCFDSYPELMATGSAISLISGAGGRALGPMTAGWIFSISTQYPTGSFLRQISWLYMLALTLPACLLAWYIKEEGDRPGREEYEAVPMSDVEEGR